MALILSILALIGVILVFIVLCYIIYMMWKKRSGVNQKMRWVEPYPFSLLFYSLHIIFRVSYQKRNREDTKVITTDDSEGDP